MENTFDKIITNNHGLDLYAIRSESTTNHYCKMVDILRLIHGMMRLHPEGETRSVLSEMQFRLIENSLYQFDSDGTVPAFPGRDFVPGRYAVARSDSEGQCLFYSSSKDGKPFFTYSSDDAQLYLNYRDASACADFLAGDGWIVLDMIETLSEEDILSRSIHAPMDADEGAEHAIPLRC